MIRKFVGMGFIGLIALCFFLSGCGSNPAAATASTSTSPTTSGSLTKVDGQVSNPQNLPAPGTYEAAGLEMVVTESGATLNTGCTKGAVPTPITLESDGSFTTTGTMNPDLPTNPPRITSISLDGKYSEQEQTLSVAITFGTGSDPQSYNLVLNAPKNLDVACPL